MRSRAEAGLIPGVQFYVLDLWQSTLGTKENAPHGTQGSDSQPLILW